jgi:hypothetical protein
VIGVLGVVGIVAGVRVLERVMEKLGQTIEQVALATGSAIGQGVQTAYTPADEPQPVRMFDDEGEAYPAPAWDPTYDFIPPEAEDRLAVLPPGTSLIPGEG